MLYWFVLDWFLKTQLNIQHASLTLAANNPGGAWDVQGMSIENVSLFIYHLLQFWKLLRKEQLKPDVSKRGNYFSMHQFRNLFNTTRIPHMTEDSLNKSWKTEKEGHVPTHVIVLRNGYMFEICFLDSQDEPYSSPVYENTLRKLKQYADSLPPGPGVGMKLIS